MFNFLGYIRTFQLVCSMDTQFHFDQLAVGTSLGPEVKLKKILPDLIPLLNGKWTFSTIEKKTQVNS